MPLKTLIALPLVALMLVVGAGCGDDKRPGLPAAPDGGSAAVTAAATADADAGFASGHPSTAVDDPPGRITCGLLSTALGDGTLMRPGVVRAIVAAASSADAPVADSADRLLAAYGKAAAAAGTPNEPDTIAAVSAAAADMSGVCRDSGFQTAG